MWTAAAKTGCRSWCKSPARTPTGARRCTSLVTSRPTRSVRVVGHVDLIQSADRRNLLEALEKEAARQGICQKVLFGGKHCRRGEQVRLSPQDLWTVLEEFGRFSHLEAVGLMAIPPVSTHPGENLQFFLKCEPFLLT